jgi:hypothetical protein
MGATALDLARRVHIRPHMGATALDLVRRALRGAVKGLAQLLAVR